MIKRYLLSKPLFVIFLLVNSWHLSGQQKPLEITLKPNSGSLMTDSIQFAIDKCAKLGGGLINFTEGTYFSGTLQLKSNVTLQFDKGSILRGSDKYSDYKNDAFVFGNNLSDIVIQGEGIIDGVDCYNANGEEGFRGPHCIRLIGCKNITIKDITIKNSANWAINCRYCSKATVQNVSIRGGHDGLHTRFCDNFTVTGCDFRTGDDSFAGNDNRDFVITDCKINTSCNAFRFGCYNFTVLRCEIWGPGEYMHMIEKQRRMPTAFTHFSPNDEDTKLPSGNWLIRDVSIDSADYVYMYNFQNGLWQTGQPVTNIRFEQIKATAILSAFNIIGDTARKFTLQIKNSSFSYRKGAQYSPTTFDGVKIQSLIFFNAKNFNSIKLQNVTFQKTGKDPLVSCNSGNSISLENVSFITGQNAIPYSFEKVLKVEKVDLKLNSSEIK